MSTISAADVRAAAQDLESNLETLKRWPTNTNVERVASSARTFLAIADAVRAREQSSKPRIAGIWEIALSQGRANPKDQRAALDEIQRLRDSLALSRREQFVTEREQAEQEGGAVDMAAFDAAVDNALISERELRDALNKPGVLDKTDIYLAAREKLRTIYSKALRSQAAQVLSAINVFRIAGGDIEAYPTPTPEESLLELWRLRAAYDELVRKYNAKKLAAAPTPPSAQE